MFLSSRRVEWYIVWPGKVKFKVWPQVKVMTWGQTYHDAYQSIRLDETTNTSNLFWSLYLVSIKSYCDETVGDLWWHHATSTAHCRGQRCTCQLVGGGKLMPPLTVFRDCTERVIDTELQFGITDLWFKPDLLAPVAFSGQVRSLTYDAIRKPLPF